MYRKKIRIWNDSFPDKIKPVKDFTPNPINPKDNKESNCSFSNNKEAINLLDKNPVNS